MTTASDPAPTDRRAKARAGVWFGLAVGLIGPLALAVAVIGRMSDLMPLDGAWTIALQRAPLLCLIGVLGGALALVSAAFARRPWLWAVAAVALILPGVIWLGLNGLRAQAERSPPLHDVATDWSDPIVFSDRLMGLRGEGSLPVERDPRLTRPWGPGGGAVTEAWAATRVADANRLACATARAIPRNIPAPTVQRVLEDQGVVLVGSAPWRVEGTARTTWFHVYSDVAVRLRPERTDIRATSREGTEDRGVNCALVSRLVNALEAAR